MFHLKFKMKKRGDMNKRGISAIVATILIILITVAGVVIIWTVILPMVTQSLDAPELEGGVEIVSSGGYTVYDPSTKVAIVQVRRMLGEAEIRNMKISFTFDGDTVSSTVEAPGESKTRSYAFNLSGFGEPEFVEVSPIFTVGNTERQGAVTSKVDIGSAPISDQPTDLIIIGEDARGEPVCSEEAERDCGTNEGECVAGTQTCVGGVWGACGGDYVGPGVEVCGNVADEDCDGVVEGDCPVVFSVYEWEQIADPTALVPNDYDANDLSTAFVRTSSGDYLFSGFRLGKVRVHKWSGSAFVRDDTTNFPLDIGTHASIEAFEWSNQKWVIAWEGDGFFNNYIWSSTLEAWNPLDGAGEIAVGFDRGIVRGKPEIFWIGSELYMIIGRGAGGLSGYVFNEGVGWIDSGDPGILTGLPTGGDYVAVTVFEMEGDTYLIRGDFGGGLSAYMWVDNTWVPKTNQAGQSIIRGLFDVGAYSDPEAFYVGGELYLVVGNGVDDDIHIWKYI